MNPAESDPRQKALLDRRAARAARPRETLVAPATEARVALVAAGGGRYGIPVEGLREIVRAPPLTPVPHAPDWLLGIAQIRGELLSVVSLARWMEAGPATSGGFVAVVTGPEGLLGLQVDEVLDFQGVAASDIADRHEGAPGRRPVRATTRDLVSILDLPRLLADERLIVDLARAATAGPGSAGKGAKAGPLP